LIFVLIKVVSYLVFGKMLCLVYVKCSDCETDVRMSGICMCYSVCKMMPCDEMVFTC
jgi:hypothetical protein